MSMTMIERATQALIAELHRQGEARGVVVEDNGVSAQVDGSFPVEPLVRAVIAAIREPSEEMERAGWSSDLPFTPSIKVGTVYQAMIGALLEERR